MIQVSIDGCPADCADGKAESNLFSTGFEAAIGLQLGTAADNVEVTSVTVTKTTGSVAGLPALTVLFVVKNVDDANQKTVQKGLSNKDTAAAVAKALQGGGKGVCPKAQVRDSFICLLTYSITDAVTHVLAHSIIRVLTHSFIHTPTHRTTILLLLRWDQLPLA